ncbi:IS701 family transposase [Streptomyces sp. NPDC004533]|uniref:IS701 family transposase n=1 Tax=Streptomyces sp. NPDC004533 TaxID=3154278 RepID=UPI00339FDB78
MTTFQNQVAVEATIAQAAWGRLFRAAMDVIAGCFARPETRATAAEMITGLLAEVDTRNCWTLAEALGHPGPHRLQHLLSRATFDHDRAREQIARLVVHELAGQDVVLVADETGDAKSSTGCVGAGRQYSGAIKGVGLCQVAVHLAAVTESVRVVIDRALYLPKAWAADEERREATGVPEVIMFATKLQQTAAMVKNALELGVQARWFVGDEVYSGRELRMKLREFGLGYAVDVSHASTVTDGAGRRWKARQMINKVLSHQWMRMQTGHGTKGTREHDWAWLDIRADDTPDGHPDGVGVLVARRHRYTGETSFYRCWSPGKRHPRGAGGGDLPQMADRGNLPTRQDLHRPRRGTGDLLELLDALVAVLADRVRRSRAHGRCHDHARPCPTGPSRSPDLPRTRSFSQGVRSSHHRSGRPTTSCTG